MARLFANPFKGTCNVCDAVVGERDGWAWNTDPIRPWPVVCDGCDEDRLITRFDDGAELTFGRGAQDAWCVYEGPPKRALRDADYFARLARLTEIQDPPVIYGDFVTIYDAAGDSSDAEVLDKIIAPMEEKYGNPLGLEALKVFTILYATHGR